MLTEKEIQIVMNALNGTPTLTTSKFADKIETILRKYKENKIMKIWCVEGIDDLEGNTFAFCSSEEKAIKGKELLEKLSGLEDILEIKKSNLELDAIIINDEKINL